MGLINSPVSIYSALSDRNCSRCGQDFIRYLYDGREAMVCRLCRTPKSNKVISRTALYGKPLSKRERQISELISEGMMNKEIAFRLRLSTGTVKVYTSRLFAKTGMFNRTSLARWWILKSDKPHITE